ncbi:hypothetical protein [Streptomyces sp. NPDC058255]
MPGLLDRSRRPRNSPMPVRRG